MSEMKNELLNLQAQSGAFHSVVHFNGQSYDDWNGFTTALVLRHSPLAASSPDWSAARRLALQFLGECEVKNRPGFFTFWPCDRWPKWAPAMMPDADCTSSIACELLRHGIMTRQEAQSIAMTSLIPYRLESAPDDHPWIRPGVFPTWLCKAIPNPIDCCVNVNVVAFLSQSGLNDVPGYAQACAMLYSGLSWSSGQRERLGRLCPYYPNSVELLYAIRNAVQYGATQLQEALDMLEASDATVSDAHAAAPLFTTADRETRWSSRAVELARHLGNVKRL
jgi:hypothetical protein